MNVQRPHDVANRILRLNPKYDRNFLWLHNRYNSEINIKYDLVSLKEVMKIRFRKYVARGDLLDGDMSAMNVIIDAIFEDGLTTIVQHHSRPSHL
jgi:hypothetical protein